VFDDRRADRIRKGERIVQKLGRLALMLGVLGIVLCLAAAAGRFVGTKEFLGFQAINIFIVGIGLQVTACWARLEANAADHS
jgi:hypothetical protein